MPRRARRGTPPPGPVAYAVGAGESLSDLRAESFDPEEAGTRGMAFEHLDQLALEHLYGVRGQTPGPDGS